jgi:hypothetical protein
MFIGAGILLAKHRHADREQRRQIVLVLLGVLVVICANIFTGIVVTLFKVDSAFIWVGRLSLFVFSLIVAYAIVKHRFFDVRPIVARSIAYVLLLITLSIIYGILVLGLAGLFFKENNDSLLAKIVYLIPALIMAFSFQPLRKLFARLSNRLFYQDAYDPQNFLDSFNNAIVGLLSLDDIINRTIGVVQRDIKPAFVSFYLSGTAHVAERLIETQPELGSVHFMRQLDELPALRAKKVIRIEELSDRTDTRRLHYT